MKDIQFAFERNKQAETVLQKIKDDNGHIILFGIGNTGKAVLKACLKQQIAVKCFCDNRLYQKVTIINACSEDGRDISVPVYSADVITCEDIVVICTVMYKDNIERQLKPIGCQIIDFLDIFAGTEWNYNEYLENTMGLVTIRESMQKKIYQNNDNSLVLDSAILMITERCTLRCNECSNMMDLYVHPSDSDWETDKTAITNFLHAITFAKKISLMGGEPFLNKNLKAYITLLLEHQNFGTLHIITNGTLIPDDKLLKLLSDNRILVTISDYHLPQQKIQMLINLFKENHVFYYIRTFANDWSARGNFEFQGMSHEETVELYRRCSFATECHMIKDGRFYICTHLANAYSLHAIPYNSEDSVSLTDDYITDKQLRQKLQSFLSKPCMKGCGYCLGGPDDRGVILPAKQIQKLNTYYKFEDSE